MIALTEDSLREAKAASIDGVLIVSPDLRLLAYRLLAGPTGEVVDGAPVAAVPDGSLFVDPFLDDGQWHVR